LAFRIGSSEDAVKLILESFFKYESDAWRHTRCDAEIEEYKAICERNRANGKGGGRPRKTQSVPDGLPGETQTEPGRNPSQEPITNNQEPINSVAKATGDKSPITTEDIIFSYGVPLLTNAGTPDKQARSFLGGLRKAHGDDALVNTLRECIRAKPLQPLEWIAAVLPPKGTKPRNQPMSFAQQDELARRKRWEEMTGRKWPEADQPNFIDVTPTTLEIGN
jgi:hypothetical protein